MATVPLQRSALQVRVACLFACVGARKLLLGIVGVVKNDGYTVLTRIYFVVPCLLFIFIYLFSCIEIAYV